MAFANPRKAFTWAIDIDGVPNLAVQKVTGIERGLNVVEHGAGNYNVKTAGKSTYGDVTLEKLKPADGTDQYGEQWLALCRTGQPSQYKRNLTVRELAPDGITTLGTWLLIGAWPSSITQTDLDRMADDNIVESIVLTVDEIRLV